MKKTISVNRLLAAAASASASILLIGCGTMESTRVPPPPPGSDQISNQAWAGAGRDAAWEGGTPFGISGSR